jgi:6-phosphogluconolactonase
MSPAHSPLLRIRPGPREAAEDCAAYILDLLTETLRGAPRATIAISGGSTPKLLFAALAEARFDWARVHFFWVDERCVPPTDAQSNFKLAGETLLAPAQVPPENVHRIYGELPPAQGAARYIEDLQAFFSPPAGELPRFDILHRGMGADAHTASLFPGDPLILDRQGLAAHVWVEKLKMDRVTLLPGVLLAAKRTILQVSGGEKADALRHVLTGEPDLLRYPCQIASRDEKAIWFLDEAAAANL